MLLSVSWLKEFIPKLPPTPTLVELLMMHGLEVESVTGGGHQFNHVVIGKIVGIRPHPNADKLRLADVIVSPKSKPQEIVCGAPNIEAGQKVAVALIGAKLPNGLTIARRAIRGIESNGMICAEDELGLGKTHTGVMILDNNLKIGTPFAKALGLHEIVLDLAIPTNRADLMSVRGLAREIGAITGQTSKNPKPKLVEGKNPASKAVSVKIQDPKLNPLLTARVVTGITMQPSPAWLVQRLRAAGMRSINVVVDVTNLVMLSHGQPLHAYDGEKLKGSLLMSRRANAGEKLTTLDGQVRTLTPDMLVIADKERAIGLAGVMGGQSTEVSDGTKTIVLEAAIFDPVSVRKTSRHLGLVSEASKRFEKGLWPSLPTEASDIAAALIASLTGGTVEKVIITAGKPTAKATTLRFKPSLVTERLGLTVSVAKSKAVLTELGFGVKGTASSWTVTVPEWRLDVRLAEDLVDEVSRIIGYENLPNQMPLSEPIRKEMPPMIRFKEEVRNILVDMGFTEVISHAFYNARDASKVKGRQFEISNPLDSNQHMLRKSLLPEIFNTLKRQANAGKDAAIFEIGYVFDPDRLGTIDQQQLWKLALGTTHKGEAALPEAISNFQKKLGTDNRPDGLKIEGPERGRFIEFCEFELGALKSASKITFGAWNPDRHISHNVHAREQFKYPAIKRDISLWTGPNLRLGRVMEVLQDQGETLLMNAEKVDEFRQGDKHSLTFRLVFQSPNRTLTKAEVDIVEHKIKDALIKLGATIR